MVLEQASKSLLVIQNKYKTSKKKASTKVFLSQEKKEVKLWQTTTEEHLKK